MNSAIEQSPESTLNQLWLERSDRMPCTDEGPHFSNMLALIEVSDL
jgi:hypothetical protein